jgi:parallel beta-helix repeat protein
MNMRARDWHHGRTRTRAARTHWTFVGAGSRVGHEEGQGVDAGIAPLTEMTTSMITAARRVSAGPAAREDRRSLPTRLGCALSAAIALVALAGGLASGARAEVPSTCSKYASSTGSDSASGTSAAPLRSTQALANSLSPGQVGCLDAGTYPGGLRVGHGGTAQAPIVLRSTPGEQAEITGRIVVPEGSNYVTIADLSLDGNGQTGGPLPSPSIGADHTTFEGDDVTDEHTEICFTVGSGSWGVADSTVIAHNHVHDCGVQPSRNQDHGIYVDDATNTQIVGNLIDHNTDRGIQLYPDATGTTVTENVISENGEGIIFGGEGSVSSSNNTIEHNLIVKSQIRSDVESYYPPGTQPGVGNVVRNNCVSTRGINTLSGGFTATANVTATAAELLPTSEGGYQAAPGSICAAVASGLGSGAVLQGPEGSSSGKEQGGDGTSSSPVPAPTSAPSTPRAGAGAATAPHDGRRVHARRARRASRHRRSATKRHHGSRRAHRRSGSSRKHA